MSAQRITIETLAAGQPRAYADSRLHVRVTLERGTADGGFEPAFCSEEVARMRLKSLPCGFTDKKKSDADWYETRLDWIKPIEARKASDVITYGKSDQTVANIWEFHTTTPFTD